MNTKLLIGGVLIVAVFIIFFVTRPEQVVAPVVETSPTEYEASPVAGTSETNTTPTPVPTTTQPTPTSTATERVPASLPRSVTVVYDGTNFTPRDVTIIEGGTVKFVNVSDQKMWVGSNDHPTHTLYPVQSDSDCLGSSFDQCTATGKDSSWSYTFTRVGAWAYHNHVRARNGGSVTVVTEEEYLKAQ